METQATLEHRCLNGVRCIDRVDGHARETNGPNAFCPMCLHRSTSMVERLPAQYLRLHHVIGDRHAGIDPGIRRAKPGSTIPLNVHVDTLLGQILDATTMAAEILAETMGMNNPEHYPAEAQVAACVAIIAPNVERLLAVRQADVMFWTRSGEGHGVTSTTGTRIVLGLDKLGARAHFALGMTRARSQRDLPCTRCKAKTVGRWAGSDDFDCSTCGSRFPEHGEHGIRRQDKILLELVKRGLVVPA